MADKKLAVKLYAVAREADKAVDNAQAALDAAIANRSVALGELAEQVGAGPYKDLKDGKIRTIRSRQPMVENDEGKKVTDTSAPKNYFFVVSGENEVIDV